RQNLLTLMNLSSAGSNPKAHFNRWISGTPDLLYSVEADQKIFYHHKYGAMANIDLNPLEKVATGQRVTAELFGESLDSAYGVCLTVSRKRQELNGFSR